MVRRKFYPLFDPADEEKVRPILDKLKKDGFEESSEESPSGRDVVLFFLSKNSKDDSSVTNDFIRYANRSIKFVPVNLDGAPLLSRIQGSIKAVNMVFADRYTTEELVERIEPELRKRFDIPNWLMYTLIAVSAVILLSVTGVIISRALSKGKGVQIVSSVDKPQETVIPNAIPEEEYENIVELTFVGDTYRWYTIEDDDGYNEPNHWKGFDDLAYRYWTDDGARWLSKEDGHEFPMTHYDDLSWIAELPNLRAVSFCAVDAEVPNLSGLEKLRYVTQQDCNIGSFEWLSRSKIECLEYHGSDVVDFSTLTLCTHLEEAYFDLVFSKEADFSDFHPFFLRVLHIVNGNDLRSVDLSTLGQCKMLEYIQIADIPITGNFSLSQCRKLYGVEIRNIPVDSLSFMSLCYSIDNVYIGSMNIRSLDGIEKLMSLKNIKLEDLPNLTDISALESCKKLEFFELNSWDGMNVTDFSVLGTLPKLRTVHIFSNSTISDIDFLNEITENKSFIFLCDTRVLDYSGLASISGFNQLEIKSNNFTDEVVPYLSEAVIGTLRLSECGNVDLSQLPHVSSKICLRNCDLTSLEGIDQSINALELLDCNELRSLEGIENLERFGDGNGILSIKGCPRLNDWSALDGKYLNMLEFESTYSLPDFSKTNAKSIIFRHVDEDILPDLSCLKALDSSYGYTLDFSEQVNITDMTPIYDLHGSKLTVPPTVQSQAQELVKLGKFNEYEVEYPQSEWHIDDSPVFLESLEELDTLPKSYLARIETVGFAGDMIYNPCVYHVEDELTDDGLKLYLCKNGSDEDDETDDDEREEERIPIEEHGTMITDLSIFKELTGLKELKIADQPLEDLEGVQYLENLEALEVDYCETLTDASAAFSLQQLKDLILKHTGITTLKGINYLYSLERLELYGVELEDETELDGLSDRVEIDR